MAFFNSFASLASLVTALLIPTAPPNGEVCFGEMGCFGNDLPCHTLGMSSPEDINTRFYLFTRSNLRKSHEISWRDLKTIESSHFNSRFPTKFILHGWIENTGKGSFHEMKTAILRAERANVILVDWRGGSLDIYDTSVQNTRVVGRELANLARKLNRIFGAPLEKMHIIGHSLGAHTAGYAGAELPGIGRITGLDPAGPYFHGRKHNDCKLDKSDALFVDVIHTDGTNTSTMIPGASGLGLQEALGHQDFYPNGGKHMTGCLPLTHCSHYRAVYYFTQSITTCKYKPANLCSSWGQISNATNCPSCNSSNKNCAQMGYRANPAKEEGSYFIKTAGTKPYCRTD